MNVLLFSFISSAHPSIDVPVRGLSKALCCQFFSPNPQATPHGCSKAPDDCLGLCLIDLAQEQYRGKYKFSKSVEPGRGSRLFRHIQQFIERGHPCSNPSVEKVCEHITVKGKHGTPLTHVLGYSPVFHALAVGGKRHECPLPGVPVPPEQENVLL